jgi:hypothetical protein
MSRYLSALFCSIILATVVHAQWQPCQPASSVCQTTGNVGIGTSAPSQALVVVGNVFATSSFSVNGVAPDGYPFFATRFDGKSMALQLRSSFAGAPAASYIGNFGNLGTYISQNREPQDSGFVYAAAPPNQHNAVQVVVGDSYRGRLFQVTNFPGGQETVRLFIDYSGNVGIGTITPSQKLDVNGNINVTGNINAKYQDVAEWVEAPTQFEPGTVVVLDRARNNAVIASTTAYDMTAAGVISERPGISLGERSESKVAVATTGRVRVKVDATHGPIGIGDLLVTSDTPGMAMKSAPVDVAGIPMHRPGTLIGKALEPLERGQGEIFVLLSLQ